MRNSDKSKYLFRYIKSFYLIIFTWVHFKNTVGSKITEKCENVHWKLKGESIRKRFVSFIVKSRKNISNKEKKNSCLVGS